MKNIKRLLALLLAVIMTVATVATVSAASITFTDTNGHWAWDRGYIPYLVEKDVLNGYNENGAFVFKPDNDVKRCEFIKMIDETFGLTKTKAVNFTDVRSTDWFCVYFQKAAAQGYLLDYGPSCDPEGKLTREEAISLLVRYLALDPDKKASASRFTDFNTVDSKYQDYVLEAIEAGLIDGIEQSDGTYMFKPKKTLTRAEALTILYRAAGCIYNKTSYKRDAGAAETNSVITKNDITIADQVLRGRTIVSEGAESVSDKQVVFSNCTIEDTLYIRGNATVYFDKCDVENVVITGKGGIALLNTSNIKNLTLSSKATVNLKKDTSIDTFNVESTANDVSVTGDGEIEMLNVKANGFNSAIMPEDFEIFNKVTAKLAGKDYSGKKDDSLIYKVAPYVATDNTYYYIELTPAKTGSLYYYYAEKDTVPAKSDFDTNYRKAEYHGYLNVSADTDISQKTYTIDQLKKLEYVVIMFQAGTEKEEPIVIPNAAADSAGFSTDPVLSANKDKITLKASAKGKVEYYYTDSCDALTPTKFQKAYNATEAALKGSVDVAAKANITIDLKAIYVATYDYIVIRFKADNGTLYKPVVLTVADTGFAVAPEVKSVGVISYKSAVTGTLYYYYSKTDTVPSEDDFLKNYNASRNASGSLASYFTVRANIASTFEYNPGFTTSYSYIIAAIKDASGNFMLPVCISLGVESGFSALPKLVTDSLIQFTTSVDGEVKFYFTTNKDTPTVDVFNYMYKVAGGKTIPLRKGLQGYITIEDEVKAAYSYVVIMLTDTNKNTYEPIVISIKFNPDDVISGFVYDPYVKSGYLYLKTAKDTKVRYYYATNGYSVTSQEFYSNYYNAMYYGEVDTVANEVKTVAIRPESLGYRYIVISVWDGTKYADPVVREAYVDTQRTENTTALTYSLSKAFPGYVSVIPYYTGTLYYFTTDDIAVASAEFNKATASQKAVTGNTATPLDTNSKKYIVVCLEANTLTYDKVVIDVSTGSEYKEDKYNDYATQGITSTNMVFVNREGDHTVSYTVKSNSIVYYTLVGDTEVIPFLGSSSRGNLGSVNAVVGSPYSYDYSSLLTGTYPGYTHVYLYVQCIDNDPFNPIVYKSEFVTIK